MNRLKPALVLLFAVTFGLSPLVTSPFGGYDPALFPVQIARPAIQPAGYAFSIWGLIYLALLAHAAFGLWKRADHPSWDRTRWPLILSLAVGTTWLWIAARDPLIATLAIMVMLGGALVALWRIWIVPDRWLLMAPVAIYAGWLTAATGVSIGVVGAGYGLLPDTAMAIVMLVCVLGLALAVQTALRRAPDYALTVVWALVGIVVANAGTNATVAAAAALGAAAAAAVAWRVARQ